MTWPSKQLADLLQLSIGGIWGHEPGANEINVRIWRVTELKRDGRLEPSTAAMRSVSKKQFVSRALRPNDLLLEKSGGGPTTPVGRVGLVRSVPEPSVCSNFMQLMRPNPEVVDARFLHLYLNHFQSRGGTLSMQSASTNIKNLKASDYMHVRVPLPGLREQRRIVEILEEHLSRLDAAETYLGSAVARVTDMKAAVLQAAIGGELFSKVGSTPDRDVLRRARRALYHEGARRGRPEPLPPAYVQPRWPSRWPLLSLEEATHPLRTISYGILKPGPDVADGVPYIRVVNMRGDRIAADELRRTTPEIAKQYERSSLEAADVLISIRGTYGRVAVVPGALAGANITQDTARLAFIDGIQPEFAALYLRSPVAQTYMKRVARGVAVKGVNIGDLRQMPFPVPPEDEQIAIVARVDQLLSDLGAAHNAADVGRMRAHSLRRALLSAAFSGQPIGRKGDFGRAEAVSE